MSSELSFKNANLQLRGEKLHTRPRSIGDAALVMLAAVGLYNPGGTQTKRRRRCGPGKILRPQLKVKRISAVVITRPRHTSSNLGGLGPNAKRRLVKRMPEFTRLFGITA